MTRERVKYAFPITSFKDTRLDTCNQFEFLPFVTLLNLSHRGRFKDRYIAVSYYVSPYFLSFTDKRSPVFEADNY